MYRSAILYVLSFLAVLQNLFKVELSAFACSDNRECFSNSTYLSICCSGLCRQWMNCPGGCISDDSCHGGKKCVRYRCEDDEIELPNYCDSDAHCLRDEECESGLCKPAPRPVEKDDSSKLHVSFHFNVNVVVIIGAVVGGLIFLSVVSYGSYRCFKRHRRRRFSRGSYSQPSRYAISFSPSRNEDESHALCRQHIRPRLVLPGRTGCPYPPRPPPEYDSVTLDSNLEVDSSSPPPYDHEQVQGDTFPRISEEQV